MFENYKPPPDGLLPEDDAYRWSRHQEEAKSRVLIVIQPFLDHPCGGGFWRERILGPLAQIVLEDIHEWARDRTLEILDNQIHPEGHSVGFFWFGVLGKPRKILGLLTSSEMDRNAQLFHETYRNEGEFRGYYRDSIYPKRLRDRYRAHFPPAIAAAGGLVPEPVARCWSRHEGDGWRLARETIERDLRDPRLRRALNATLLGPLPNASAEEIHEWAVRLTLETLDNRIHPGEHQVGFVWNPVSGAPGKILGALTKIESERDPRPFREVYGFDEEQFRTGFRAIYEQHVRSEILRRWPGRLDAGPARRLALHAPPSPAPQAHTRPRPANEVPTVPLTELLQQLGERVPRLPGIHPGPPPRENGDERRRSAEESRLLHLLVWRVEARLASHLADGRGEPDALVTSRLTLRWLLAHCAPVTPQAKWPRVLEVPAGLLTRGVDIPESKLRAIIDALDPDELLRQADEWWRRCNATDSVSSNGPIYANRRLQAIRWLEEQDNKLKEQDNEPQARAALAHYLVVRIPPESTHGLSGLSAAENDRGTKSVRSAHQVSLDDERGPGPALPAPDGTPEGQVIRTEERIKLETLLGFDFPLLVWKAEGRFAAALATKRADSAVRRVLVASRLVLRWLLARCSSAEPARQWPCDFWIRALVTTRAAGCPPALPGIANNPAPAAPEGDFEKVNHSLRVGSLLETANPQLWYWLGAYVGTEKPGKPPENWEWKGQVDVDEPNPYWQWEKEAKGAVLSRYALNNFHVAKKLLCEKGTLDSLLRLLGKLPLKDAEEDDMDPTEEGQGGERERGEHPSVRPYAWFDGLLNGSLTYAETTVCREYLMDSEQALAAFTEYASELRDHGLLPHPAVVRLRERLADTPEARYPDLYGLLGQVPTRPAYLVAKIATDRRQATTAVFRGVESSPGAAKEFTGFGLQPGDTRTIKLLTPEGAREGRSGTVKVVEALFDPIGRTASLTVTVCGLEEAELAVVQAEIGGIRYSLAAPVENAQARFQLDEVPEEVEELGLQCWYALPAED